MNHRAFLLGFFSIGGQVLLLRELVSSLNGDELFIGTALFGWLVAVAIGAWAGGRLRYHVSSVLLLIVGALILPVVIVIARLSPLLVSDVNGEIIPFTTAAAISMLMMCPVALVSGWLFASITREGRPAAQSIVRVYLIEGIGAFVGGVLISLLVGGVVSTLEMAVLLSGGIIGATAPSFLRKKSLAILIGGTALLALVLVARRTVARVDRHIDSIKYESYDVRQSFDTHYAHQSVLFRDSMLVLLTDNTLEASHPDWETAENLLIPPLLYRPDAENVLFFGRAEFGVMQLTDRLQDVRITAVDPRSALSRRIDQEIIFAGQVVRIDLDPVTFVTRRRTSGLFDVVVINPGGLETYRGSRLLTGRFLTRVRSSLAPGGIVLVPTHLDTDRYITAEQQQLLAAIYNVLRNLFTYVTVWPGNMTLFLASDEAVLALSEDSLEVRLGNLDFTPQYINRDYLYDRLSPLRVERLGQAVGSSTLAHSLDRPVIPHYQALYAAKTAPLDKQILSFVVQKQTWLVVVPALIVVALILLTTTGPRQERFGLYLYLVAGLASLTLELISLYVYQSLAGSLYAEMAVLIGAFMLGLAFGTYYSSRRDIRHLEFPALLLLLLATVLFLFTYDRVQPQALLFYHLLFLFVAAAGTGSLFVAATNRYYRFGRTRNRGIGYACEVAGSALGALLAITIVLPVIGLHWLLGAVAVLLASAFVGSMFTVDTR